MFMTYIKVLSHTEIFNNDEICKKNNDEVVEKIESFSNRESIRYYPPCTLFPILLSIL